MDVSGEAILGHFGVDIMDILSFKLALVVTVACILGPSVYYLYQYQSSIQRRLNEIENKLAVRVVRNKDTTSNKKNHRVICMELDPAFVAAHPTWPMMSLGEYLTQLEPAKDSLPLSHLFLRKELELTIGDLLLRTLGRTYGAALLPILGTGSVVASIGGLSSRIARFLERSILPTEEEEEEDSKAKMTTTKGAAAAAAAVLDPMSIDLSLIEIVSLLNVYQKSIPSSTDPLSPLVYLSRGESGEMGELAFDNGDGTFPTTFNMDTEFHMYVAAMQHRILETDKSYDPEDKSYPLPTPISPRLLPDLYFGKSPDVKCTHSKHECIEHRLVCVLLNKLCHNYYKLSRSGGTEEECFVVVCAGERCLFPEELLTAMSRCGHTIEVCPRSMVTNFGMQLCVKEDDGSYTQVPTAMFLNTGIERSADGQMTYFAAPHGGMDVRISGPMVGGGGRPAYLQFYVSKEGLTCFHPDEDQDTPWQAKTSLADVYSPSDTVRAVRMCSIVSVTFNRIATEFDLPFGGYGILGMCNDSSTMIDFAIRGKTNAYPLLSTGRYLNHIVQYFVTLMTELSSNKSAGVLKLTMPVIDDVRSLIQGTSQLPSDLHISPSTLIGTSARHNATYGVPIFQHSADAKMILGEMADSARKFCAEGFSGIDQQSPQEE